MSTWVSRLIASTLMLDGLLRTASKCSAHLSRMHDFSVMSVVPPALSKGWARMLRAIHCLHGLVEALHAFRVSIALDSFCFLTQPCVLHFMQFLLNRVASVAKGGLACWWLVADVGPVQSVLLLQQLGDFYVVLVQPVLVFALGGAKGLIGCCIHGVAEGGPAVFHVICDLDVLCALLHCVGQLSTNWRLLQFRDVKSLWCWLSLGSLLWENSDLYLGDD